MKSEPPDRGDSQDRKDFDKEMATSDSSQKKKETKSKKEIEDEEREKMQ